MVFTKDYDGTVVTLSRESACPVRQSTLVTAWGGMVMDDLVRCTLDNGLYGMENLSAIPGTVGASAVQNVGAYGAEAKDFIESVEAYDLKDGHLCTFSNADCRFAYRYSMFKDIPGRYLILRVTFRLKKEYAPNLSYKALADERLLCLIPAGSSTPHGMGFPHIHERLLVRFRNVGLGSAGTLLPPCHKGIS